VNDIAQCAALPSGQAAADLWAGDRTAIARIAWYTGVRALLIGAGLWVVGSRRNLVRSSVAGALAVEAYVLVWAAQKKKEAA